MSANAPPVLARAVRDHTVESVHRGHAVLVDADGVLLGMAGNADHPTYVRSAVKPFQTLAVAGVLAEAGIRLEVESLAIATASHEGSPDQQIEAAHLLALAGLDETALLCPPALPIDVPTLLQQKVPMPLAHNCSGKHGGFLFAQVVLGEAPQRYLDPAATLQERVRDCLVQVSGSPLRGPGIDGCGAPAWVMPLRGLATAFARLAGGRRGLALVASAMRARPDLIGGEHSPDTAIMREDRRVVAKRGAEGVLAAGLLTPTGAVGVAVKIEDGAARAAGPAVASVLARLGARVPVEVLEPPVLGGGRPCGQLQVDAAALASLRTY